MNKSTSRCSLDSWMALMMIFILSIGGLLVGCGGGNGSIHGDGTSGVRGVIMRSSSMAGTASTPASNVTVSIQEPSSQQLGVGAAVQLGPPLAQTQTDAQGNYSFTLAPGNYTVSVLTYPGTNNYNSGSHVTVIVPSRQYVQADLTIIGSSQ